MSVAPGDGLRLGLGTGAGSRAASGPVWTRPSCLGGATCSLAGVAGATRLLAVGGFVRVTCRVAFGGLAGATWLLAVGGLAGVTCPFAFGGLSGFARFTGLSRLGFGGSDGVVEFCGLADSA